MAKLFSNAPSKLFSNAQNLKLAHQHRLTHRWGCKHHQLVAIIWVMPHHPVLWRRITQRNSFNNFGASWEENAVNHIFSPVPVRMVNEISKQNQLEFGFHWCDDLKRHRSWNSFCLPCTHSTKTRHHKPPRPLSDNPPEQTFPDITRRRSKFCFKNCTVSKVTQEMLDCWLGAIVVLREGLN